jgi:hypothetical protein
LRAPGLGKIRTFATGVIALTEHAHRLKIAVLTCLLLAWPLCGNAQATAAGQPPGSLTISATMNDSGANDPLQLWFKEQDKLLDDILLRLARIEHLVSDIHRLISQLPNAVAVTALPVAPQPVASLPVQVKPPPPAEHEGTLPDWAPQLAGGGLIVLLLLWWSRRRRAAVPKTVRATPAPAAVPPPPTFTPPEQPSVPPAVKVAPPPASASVQTNGASNTQGDQAIELAEIMLSMGLGRGAAQTLAEQIRNEPKQALRQWLKLLEIYRQNGQQDEFERSAEEMRQHFNVQPEDWQTRPEAYRSIADYPHIAARLSELWGRPSCLNYLGNLLDDNRGGARAGFPQTVAEELLLLTAMLRAEGIVAEAETAAGTA